MKLVGIVLMAAAVLAVVIGLIVKSRRRQPGAPAAGAPAPVSIWIVIERISLVFQGFLLTLTPLLVCLVVSWAILVLLPLPLIWRLLAIGITVSQLAWHWLSPTLRRPATAAATPAAPTLTPAELAGRARRNTWYSLIGTAGLLALVFALIGGAKLINYLDQKTHHNTVAAPIVSDALVDMGINPFTNKKAGLDAIRDVAPPSQAKVVWDKELRTVSAPARWYVLSDMSSGLARTTTTVVLVPVRLGPMGTTIKVRPGDRVRTQLVSGVYHMVNQGRRSEFHADGRTADGPAAPPILIRGLRDELRHIPMPDKSYGALLSRDGLTGFAQYVGAGNTNLVTGKGEREQLLYLNLSMREKYASLLCPDTLTVAITVTRPLGA